MKKFGIFLAGFFGIIILVLAVVPWFIDVDQYRPWITEQASHYIDGELKIGKLKLSLWGKAVVRVDGLELTTKSNEKILEVKKASFEMPLMSLISGAPKIDFVLDEPSVYVTKDKTGKLNVLSLIKSSEVSGSGASAGTASAGVGGAGAGAGSAGAGGTTSSQTPIPSIALKASLTFILSKANLSYKDLFTGDSYQIKDLNFKLKDISLEREMPFEIFANIDLTALKTIKISGPIEITGSVLTLKSKEIIDGKEVVRFNGVETKGNIDLSKLLIDYPTIFTKKPNVRLGLDWNAKVNMNSSTATSAGVNANSVSTNKVVGAQNIESAIDVNVSKLDFYLADITLSNTLKAKSEKNLLNVNYKLKSTEIELERLKELVPMFAQFGVKGKIKLMAEVNGPSNNLDYESELNLSGIELKNEMLKQPLQINGKVSVITNKLKELSFIVQAKDFDLKASGVLENFFAPRFKFNISSQRMNFDSLLVMTEKMAKERKQKVELAQNQTKNNVQNDKNKEAQKTDFNLMLAPIRQNPILSKANGSVDVRLNQIQFAGISINNLSGEFKFSDLMAQIQKFSMQIFGGKIEADSSFSMKQEKPLVSASLKIENLSTQKMLEESVPFAKNTLKGKIAGKFSIAGSGINPSEVMNQWKGQGGLSFSDAQFTTLDIGRELKTQVYEKLPQAIKNKARYPESLTKWKGEYKLVDIQFGLDQGTFFIKDITCKAMPNAGLDCKGSGKIKLDDYALDLQLDIIDTYNLFNLDKDVKTKYGHFALSVPVKGTLLQPKFDYTQAVESLAKAAVLGAGKDALQRALGNKLPPQLNKFIGGGSGDANGGANSAGSGNNQNPIAQPPKAEDVKKALKGLFGR
jgi:hypothetical protein